MARPAALSLGVFIAAYLAGFVLPSFYLTSMAGVWIYAMMAVGAVPLIRDLGLPSLGQGVYLGLSAYTTALLILHDVVPVGIAAVLGVALAVVFSVPVGAVLLRATAPYFMIATLALGQLLSGVASSLTDFAGGDDGLVGLPAELAGVNLADPAAGYYAALTVLVVAYALVAWLRSTRAGYRVKSLRKHQPLAAMLGVAPLRTKLMAFIVGAASSGIGGVLLLCHDGYAHPSMLGVAASSVIFLIVAVASGMPLIGVIFTAVLIGGANSIAASYTEHSSAVLGIIVLVVYGLTCWPKTRDIVKVLTPGRRRGTPPASNAGPEPERPLPVRRGAPAGASTVARTDGPALDARGLGIAYGGVEVLQNVSLTMRPGDRLGIIGPNGAGKTTLINLLTGMSTGVGEVAICGRSVTGRPVHTRARLGMTRTFQVASPVADWSVGENLAFAVAMQGEVEAMWGTPLARIGPIRAGVHQLAEQWALTNHLPDRVDSLAYGIRRVVELAMATCGHPRVLLLDEPEAGLSSDQGRELVTLISQSLPDTAILLVEHDVETVFQFATRVMVLEHGVVIAEGAPEDVRLDPVVRSAYLGSTLADADREMRDE